MITTCRDGSAEAGWYQTQEAGIQVHWLPIAYSNHMSFFARVRAFIHFAWSASRKAASINSDVVFATSTPLTVAIPAVYASLRRNCPMVFEVRDLWPEMPIAVGALRNPIAIWAARKLEQYAYSNASAVVALSPGMRLGILSSGAAPDSVEVIPNSCDLAEFDVSDAKGERFRELYGLPKDKMLVTYAGTFGHLNGVGYLVRLAAALSSNRALHFLAVGGGRERLEIEALARKLGVLDDNLTLIDQIKKCDMPAVLSATDIATSLFLPIKEMEANSANKFFDGLAASRCVAVNYGGWHAELLTQSGAGFQLDHDPLVAAKQLAHYCEDPQRVKTAGLRARELAERHFARDMLAAKLEKVLSVATGEC